MDQKDKKKKEQAEQGQEKISPEKREEVKKAAQNIASLEDITTGSIRSDDDFQKSSTAINWDEFIQKAISQHFEKAFCSRKKPDDLILDIIVAILIWPLILLHEYLKQKRKALKEAQKKNQAEKEKAIKESLKSKGLSKLALVNRIAFLTQKQLMDFSMLPIDKNGKIITENLTPYQKAHYKKYLFVSQLPRMKNGSFAFHRFSRSQKRVYARFVMSYAAQNREFKKYIYQMAEAYIPHSKFKELGIMAARMSIESRGPVYRPYNRQYSRAD